HVLAQRARERLEPQVVQLEAVLLRLDRELLPTVLAPLVAALLAPQALRAMWTDHRVSSRVASRRRVAAARSDHVRPAGAGADSSARSALANPGQSSPFVRRSASRAVIA